jgi:hypothetical protein
VRHRPGGRDDGDEVAAAQRRRLERRAHYLMNSVATSPGSDSVSS